ncbi:DUF4097 family beta strand repeat-containing protein [Streptomyces phyllanthi]|uniref:DUF4097 domain-containing protein n=1 Tax=Streptomyces phyllanthi TaxID=1803180 RepID=A0A5N8W8Q2_9ACTN|nr:DUF4097 family beta strand repeat-containing protein [Streptomyces phyllanthi]MPY42798.1 DUF4097 domain-containing protein [Streptomyces phyllanthi]
MSRSAHPARTAPVRAAVVTGAVAALMAGLTACGASAGDDSDPERRSFALQGRTLTVDSDDSALDLVSADVDEVRVTRWFQGRVVMGGEPRITWEMKDDRLKLRKRCSGFISQCAARHRIEVPRGVAVVVKDGDGSVTAKGFGESLDIRTEDGSVRVTDSTGPLKLHTGDGSVHAVGIESRDVRATTRDGSVRLEFGVVPDLVEADSDDGSVTIGLPRETYDVTAETDDGAVDVSVPDDKSSDHVVTARSEDGSVTVRTAN